MSNYYDKQSAKVKLASILSDRGFTIYGFREDESDSMTDYWSPARWDGVAELNGYVVCVDVYSVENGGGRKCSTYANGQRIESIEPWPTYQANPSRTNWHVEKDGVIIAKGNGLVAADRDVDKLQRIADRIIEACNATQPVLDETPIESVDGVTITHNEALNGIEIRFAEKPAAGVIAMLKENGFRWSGRGFWYAKQTPERVTFAEALRNTSDVCETVDQVEMVETIADVETVEAVDEQPNAKRVYITVKRVNGWSDSFLVLYSAVSKQDDHGHNIFDHDAARAEIVAHYPNLSTGDYAYKLGQCDYEYVQTSTPPTFSPSDRVPVSRIVFTWSESHTIEGGEMFTRWSDANELIRRAEREHVDKYGMGGGYFKTGFIVSFADGYTYEGRIDINETDNNLSDHIRDFNQFHAGTHKPAHMTQQQYDNMITGIYAEYVDQAREFLARYILDDEPTTPNDTTPKHSNVTTVAEALGVDVYESLQLKNAHFKVWNMDAETIAKRLESAHIDYIYIGEKFMFRDLSPDEFQTVRSISDENGSILFEDDDEPTYEFWDIWKQNADRVYDKQTQPVDNVVSFMSKKAEKTIDALTPEQQLKMSIMSQMIGRERVAEAIALNISIDDLFSITAHMMYANKQ